LSETEVIEFLVELLELLAFIHQESEIHGDIKPDNIMRRKQDSALILVDIMGKVSGDIPSGTFGYMPHEQWDWNAKCSNATYCSEVYSAGITAIEALTGICPRKLPKDTETQELNWRDRVEVRDELADILNKMVRCDSNQRYQSASEVLQDLKKLA
jgi:serine/threonine protein kinase